MWMFVCLTSRTLVTVAYIYCTISIVFSLIRSFLLRSLWLQDVIREQKFQFTMLGEVKK